MPVTADTRALAGASRALHGFDRRVDDMAEVVVEDIAGAALVNVRKRRAKHHRTGKGERFVKLTVRGTGARRVARVHAGGRVAHLLTGGTRAHIIEAVDAQALRIGGISAVGGFAASVRHPGTAPDPFVAKGIADTRDEVAHITDTAGDELAATLARDIRRA